MKKISIAKRTKYIGVKYYDFEEAWCLERKDAVRFIDSIYKLEDKAEKMIQDNSWPFTKEAVVLHFFYQLDSIATGIDMRSKLNLDELSTRFVERYNEIYMENRRFCADTIDFVIKAGPDDSYMKDWRRYDKYNELNKKFNFGLAEINIETFQLNELQNMLDITKQINELLTKKL